MKGTISTADLEELGACQDQIDRFREIFKDADTGVAVDVENVLAADAGGLKLAWLARHVFTTQCHGEYVAAFDRILVECHHAVRRAYDEFARELAGLDGEGGGGQAAALGKRRMAVARAGHDCDWSLASAWVDAYHGSMDKQRKGGD